MNTGYLPAVDVRAAAEPTRKHWIIRLLAADDTVGAGSTLCGDGSIASGSSGIEFADGSILIGEPAALAALGHALVLKFDPPSLDPPSVHEVDAAGPCGTSTDGARPRTGPEVARARPPIVWIAETSTSHFDWLGTGATEDQARDSLLRAWRAHAAETGADPDMLRPDELNVRHGALGTAWRDFDPFPPAASHPAPGHTCTGLRECTC